MQCCGVAAQFIIHHSYLVRRVLDVVEVVEVLDFPAPSGLIIYRSNRASSEER